MIYSSNCQCSKKASRKKKCITRLWDLNIPSELLQEILSRLGPKDNIIASTVCKTWFEAAVSVRKFNPLPWLFHRPEEGDHYILFDPSSSQRYKKNIPELKGHNPIYSRDGWLLMAKNDPLELDFFFNPFTRECIYLPIRSLFLSGTCLAFSAPPTSTSCLVVSFTHFSSKDPFVIATWRHGETRWTIRRLKNQSSSGKWLKCVFSNGVFYGFSNSGYVGAFDPCNATWDVLPVKPWGCPAFCRQIDFKSKNVLLMEHNGNIFVTDNMSSVFKLNLERMVWEEKSEVSGLKIFARFPHDSFRGCKRNRNYPSTNELHRQYYSLFDEKSSCPLTCTPLSNRVAWVDPPHNDFTL
ncbi:hypothetical protein N665_0864s0008 [Sinapis alba]|nr:hypothetical protein N665_0864s0008 [Sinapis alba]